MLGVGERKFHGQSHSSNCCLSNHSRQLRPGPLPPLQGKRRSPGCLNGFGLGWEEADSVSSPTPVALNLWLGGRGTAASRRRPNSPPIGPSPPGRGLGRAAPARCEARTSGIPREDSEVLSAVGLMARPRWTGKAWTCLLPARKCCECRLRFSLRLWEETCLPKRGRGSVVFRRAPRDWCLEERGWALRPDGGPVSNLDPPGFRDYGVRGDSEESRSKSVLVTVLLFGTNEVSSWSVMLLWHEGQDPF